MIDDDANEEGIGWPSYVDFLSTFSFILIIFVAFLLYLLSGDLGTRRIETVTQNIAKDLHNAHFVYVIRGDQLVISLKDQVNFRTGCPNADGRTCQGIPPADVKNLHALATIIARNHNYRYIIVEGRTDTVAYKDNPFGNWDLSARRALAVLRYFYLCKDCGYDLPAIQRKLVLKGWGDTAASQSAANQSTDRRVDVVLDYGTAESGVQP